MSELKTAYRTHTCGQLRAADVTPEPTSETEEAPPETVLSGFVAKKFDDTTILLRDRYGMTLVVAAPEVFPYVPERFGKLVIEDVVLARGRVALRDEADPNMPTGEVYLIATHLEILSSAATVPEGVLADEKPAPEERLALRQLYLRRPEVQERLAIRSAIVHEAREHLVTNGFLEVETPQLFWYDPVAIAGEIIPHGDGKAWRLSSGPVVLNQYLKGGQFDRTFQFTKITRRERRPTPMHAPEHTALDINMSYVDVEDILTAVDALLAHIWTAALGAELKLPIQRLSYADALLRFGTDKVDLRVGLEISDILDAVPGKVVRAFVVPGAAAKLADEDLIATLPEAEKVAALLTWLRVGAERKVTGPAIPQFKTPVRILNLLKAKEGDLVLFSIATKEADAAAGAGAARLALGKKLELADPTRHEPVWITDYPFLEEDENLAGNHVARVVVFSQVADEDQGIATDPAKRPLVRAKAFDLMLDGVEIGSGYVGNYNLTVQRMVWAHLFKLGTDDLFRLRAPIESHRFGVPPHGGLNIGFDRLVALLLGLDAIDEVIAYPKDERCRDLLLDAPGPVPPDAIQDLVAEVPKPEYGEAELAKEVSEL